MIRNNAFSLKYGQNANGGLFGFATQCSTRRSGNYIYETGQPLSLG